MSKLQIISDKNKKSSKIKIIIKKIGLVILIKESTIVIGGDGFMLQTLKRIKILENIFMV